ncbi:5' nucleotidase, NT5C type [Desulfitobacterium sp.]|uniref:5' nucleotidase, NT5C type n=1 Tax=Desulfitobacterium sp. TaxID=49981 RepID=UPI002BE39D3C|nr:hypothetical protein [Desulfitobacterium sp.]HVJ50684.1 hypothetical protein [Desulfitobacterium sp.]
MRIGIDIDGVTSDSYTAWLVEFNRYYGKNISVLEDYDIHLVYDVSWDEMNDFFKQNTEKLFMLPQPMKGAKKGIESLLTQGHEIIYITARSADEEEVTLRWMDKYKIPYDQVVFSDFKSKVELAKQWQLELFIEDYLKNAKAIADAGVPVLLLNASYNQGELSKEIKRCRDWMEIVKEINKVQK